MEHKSVNQDMPPTDRIFQLHETAANLLVDYDWKEIGTGALVGALAGLVLKGGIIVGALSGAIAYPWLSRKWRAADELRIRALIRQAVQESLQDNGISYGQ